MKRNYVYTFTLNQPFGGLVWYPVRVLVYASPEQVTARFNQMPGARCASIYAYYAAERFVRAANLHHLPLPEICFSATALDVGLIAHEALHCVMDAKRDGILRRGPDGWEETLADAIQWLTLSISNRTRSLKAFA